MLIDELIVTQNYSENKWEHRGLNPSSMSVILELEKVTKQFLIDLKKLAIEPNMTQVALTAEVLRLVDKLPWSQFDTEEREFMADVLAPAIESLGLEPWQFF